MSKAQLAALLHLPLAGWSLGLAVVSVCQLLLAARWWLYLGMLSARPPWRSALLIYGQSWAFSLTPGRSGEAIRALWLQQRCSIPVSVGLAALAAERMTGLLAGLLLLVGFLSGSAPLALALVLALVAGLFWVVTHPALLSQLGSALPSTAPQGLKGIPLRLLRHFFQVLSQARRLLTLQGLVLGIGTALFTWMLESSLLWFLWHCLGSSVGLHAAVVVRVAMGMAGVLSLFPGGLGVGDGTALGLSLLYGLKPEQAIGATLIFRLLTLAYPVGLGLIALAIHKAIGRKKSLSLLG